MPTIEHKPGLAAEMLRELAPLLAEEGIDVDNIDVPDLDTLQAAMNRAVERHNLARFTPVSHPREPAIEDVHRAVLDAVLVAGDETSTDAPVVRVLPGLVAEAGARVEPFDDALGHLAVVAIPVAGPCPRARPRAGAAGRVPWRAARGRPAARGPAWGEPLMLIGDSRACGGCHAGE